MGLFGGFKAKFTKNSTPKGKPQEVVCLRYHIHSEFDSQDVPLPIISNNIKKTEAVRNVSKKKDRKLLAKSAIFPDNETSQSSLSSSTPQKSLSLTNLNDSDIALPNGHVNGHAESTDPITISTTFSLPSNGKSVAISDTKIGKSTEEHNGIHTEKVAVVTTNHIYTKDHDGTKTKHSRKAFSKVSNYDEETGVTNNAQFISNTEATYSKPHENKHLEADRSTLIFMTQNSSRNSSFDRSMETDDINFTKSLPLNSNKIQATHNKGNFNGATKEENDVLKFTSNQNDDDDVDYFKINVVQHDPNRTYSFSEDERSIDEEEPRFAKMGFSSQAASIFFGEGEEAEVARPRRIQLTEDDDEERRSSGADC